jgi:hypothetical protein
MAFYDTIKLVAGDDKPELNFTLRDSNTAVAGQTLDPDDPSTWDPIDLTGQIVRVHFRDLGGDTILDTMTCGIHNQTTNIGQCFMQWNATTLDVEAGTYEAEIELTDAVGKILTIFDKLKFKVRADF